MGNITFFGCAVLSTITRRVSSRASRSVGIEFGFPWASDVIQSGMQVICHAAAIAEGGFVSVA